MTQNDTKSPWIGRAIALGAGVGFAIAIIVCWAWQGMSSQTVAIAFPGGFTLDLQAAGNQMSHVAVLEQMYAEEFSRAGLEGWLEEKSIYQISNRAIAAPIPLPVLRPSTEPFPPPPWTLDSPLIRVQENRGRFTKTISPTRGGPVRVAMANGMAKA